jgi:hypothetical protein
MRLADVTLGLAVGLAISLFLDFKKKPYAKLNNYAKKKRIIMVLIVLALFLVGIIAYR